MERPFSLKEKEFIWLVVWINWSNRTISEFSNISSFDSYICPFLKQFPKAIRNLLISKDYFRASRIAGRILIFKYIFLVICVDASAWIPCWPRAVVVKRDIGNLRSIDPARTIDAHNLPVKADFALIPNFLAPSVKSGWCHFIFFFWQVGAAKVSRKGLSPNKQRQ